MVAQLLAQPDLDPHTGERLHTAALSRRACALPFVTQLLRLKVHIRPDEQVLQSACLSGWSGRTIRRTLALGGLIKRKDLTSMVRCRYGQTVLTLLKKQTRLARAEVFRTAVSGEKALASRDVQNLVLFFLGEPGFCELSRIVSSPGLL